MGTEERIRDGSNQPKGVNRLRLRRLLAAADDVDRLHGNRVLTMIVYTPTPATLSLCLRPRSIFTAYPLAPPRLGCLATNGPLSSAHSDVYHMWPSLRNASDDTNRLGYLIRIH